MFFWFVDRLEEGGASYNYVHSTKTKLKTNKVLT